MILRLLLCAIFACALAGCSSPAKKKEADKKQKEETELADMANDPDFQAFIGRLRSAVAAHDMDTMAGMMTTNFGYRLNPPGEGEGVFKYWDDQMVWPKLQSVIGQRFIGKIDSTEGLFMVAPPGFATDPANYHGYRAGIRLVNGAWKFAYFVTD
jgi:hypothetical protein